MAGLRVRDRRDCRESRRIRDTIREKKSSSSNLAVTHIRRQRFDEYVEYSFDSSIMNR
jgi:hypothetical protein